MQLCDALTRLFWPNYIQHPWVGEPYLAKREKQFKDRLLEVRSIKDLCKQIATLLEDDDVRHVFSTISPFRGMYFKNVEPIVNIFESFADINIFDTSKFGQTKWNKALEQFEHLLQPIDERIASAVKSQLNNHLGNPRQVIFIFSKYETLIQRPAVLELLTIEREQFLQSLHTLLQDLRKAMTDTNMESDMDNLSVICNECRWLKVVEYQVRNMQSFLQVLQRRNVTYYVSIEVYPIYIVF